MLQKGTGERFKYKDAVKAVFPASVCKAVPFGMKVFYIVRDGEIPLSPLRRSSERAWEFAWYLYVKK